jgi:hypothetical protein
MDERNYLLRGLHLQRAGPVLAQPIQSILEAALEIAADGQPLPPIGFVADLRAVLGQQGSLTPARESHRPETLAPGVLRAYEDHVVARLFADPAIERAGNAWRGFQGRDKARGLAFILRQLQEQVPLGGLAVAVSPHVVRKLLRESPEEVLASGAAALAAGGASAEWTKLYEDLIAAFRRAGQLLGPGDLFELEHGTALQPLGERVALRQVLRAADMLENALPRHRPRPNPSRPDMPTIIQAEDAYPIGGYASLSNRGSIESLLPSQLAFMEAEVNRPDLFDLKYLRDELLYFSRDENQFLRRRSTFVFALWPDLAQARVKDRDLPFQRLILLLGWLVTATRKLFDWLSSDAVTVVLALPRDAKEARGEPLAPERALWEVVFREEIARGAISVAPLTHPGELRQLCSEAGRRSQVRCLSVSTQEQTADMEGVEVTYMKIAGPVPVAAGLDLPEAAEPLEAWSATLQSLLQRWL